MPWSNAAGAFCVANCDFPAMRPLGSIDGKAELFAGRKVRQSIKAIKEGKEVNN